MSFSSIDWAPFGPGLLFAFVALAGAWLGTVLSARSLCARARLMADPEETGRLAASVFARWAWLWLALSMVAAAARAGLVLGAQPLHDRAFVVQIVAFAVLFVLHLRVWRRAAQAARGDVGGLRTFEEARTSF